MTKPWRPLAVDEIDRLTGQLGVYEIADADGRVLYAGAANARSLFGLKGVLAAELETPRPGAARFRVEVTVQYTTRLEELLMVHAADSGRLPRDNADEKRGPLGRLSPA